MKVHRTISIWQCVREQNVSGSIFEQRIMGGCEVVFCRHRAVIFSHIPCALENYMCTCCMMMPYILTLLLSSIFNFLWWCRKATKKHRRTHSIMETKWKRKRCEHFFSSLLNAPHMTDVSIYKNALYPLYFSHLPALYPLFIPPLPTSYNFIHSCVFLGASRFTNTAGLFYRTWFSSFVSFSTLFERLCPKYIFLCTKLTSSLFCAPLNCNFMKFCRSCSAVGCNKNKKKHIKDNSLLLIWIVLTWHTHTNIHTHTDAA